MQVDLQCMFQIFRAEDAGTFSCLAENEAGTASVSTKLTVHGMDKLNRSN